MSKYNITIKAYDGKQVYVMEVEYTDSNERKEISSAICAAEREVIESFHMPAWAIDEVTYKRID